ncbi:hypothetical protein [Rhizobium sp. WSM1325]|uniref:hypothetical protein n=1 Tax=Rhizobium sp. WSM1325 TaxID=3444086 RepID=UPI000FF49922|nr:hypothetical protein [Rhizobium leguminosarum]RWY70029.1 hypothetical protein EHI48_27060 [Rhizobium leguminosarum]
MNLFGILKGVTYFAAAGASITNGFAADRMILTSNVQTLPSADFLLKQAPVIDFKSTVQEMQQNGLPVSIIASIMRVERKTVYAWMKDAQPRRDAVDRLALVYPILKSAFGTHLKTAHRLWNTKDRSSVTLESLLTAPAIDAAATEKYLATFASAIRRYAAQDSAAMPSARGGNALLDEIPIVDFDRT